MLRIPIKPHASIKVVLALAVVAWSVIGAIPAGAGSTQSLTVYDFTFFPTALTIPAGTTVVITNTGPSTHTWTSDSGDAQQWDSGPIAPGSSFSVTFSQAGSFGFHCNIHHFMTGTIVVVAATPSTTAPPTTMAAPATTSPAAVTTPTSSGGTAAGTANTASTPTPGAVATLPHTGASNAGALLAAAATLTLLGFAFLASGGRRRRRVGA